jgi:hypothetical protein
MLGTENIGNLYLFFGSKNMQSHIYQWKISTKRQLKHWLIMLRSASISNFGVARMIQTLCALRGSASNFMKHVTGIMQTFDVIGLS